MSTEVVDRGDSIPDVDQQAKEAADAAAKQKADEEAAAKTAADKKGDEDDDRDPDGEPAKRIRIPKARVDEMTRKHKEREEALVREKEALEQELAKTRLSTDFQQLKTKSDELAEKYEDLMADGKIKEAKEVRKEMSELQLYMIDALAGAKASVAQREAVADIKYDMLLTRIESEHPVLNPDGDAFDEDIANEVSDTMNRLVATGVPKDRALARAVKYVVGTPAGKTDDKKDLPDKRGEEARKKAVDAVGKTPASLAKHGSDSDKAGGSPADASSILRLSQDDFAKLDPAALARLRGDEL